MACIRGWNWVVALGLLGCAGEPNGAGDDAAETEPASDDAPATTNNCCHTDRYLNLLIRRVL